MRTPEVVGSHDRPAEQRSMPRPKRRTHSGPISFGQVLQTTRRQRHGSTQEEDRSAFANPIAAFDHALLSGSVAGVQHQEQIDQIHTPRTGLSAADRLAQSPASLHNMRVTPERAMQLIEDVTREMNGASGTRELHLELEPQHLGPIVASIMIDRGRISVRMRARQEDAAQSLRGGADSLRDRLAGLGFAQVQVDVEHDDAIGSSTT